MKHILVLILAGAAWPAWAGMSAEQRRCRDALATTPFFRKAPEPGEIVSEYIEHLGAHAGALVGAESIRSRLDRAFARHLLKHFDVLALGVPAGEAFEVDGKTFCVGASTARELVIHTRGVARPILAWNARGGYGEPSAARALDIDEERERADARLNLHPTLGVAVLGELIERHLPAARRMEIRTEIDVWERYLEELRLAFNRDPVPSVRLSEAFRVFPRSEHTLH